MMQFLKTIPGLKRVFSPLKSEPNHELRYQIILTLGTSEEVNLSHGFGMILDF